MITSTIRATGFAVPILFPRVSDLSWEAIKRLRDDKHMRRFRQVMREVEAAALDTAVGGDLEAGADIG